MKDKIIKNVHEGRTNHRGIDEVTKEIKKSLSMAQYSKVCTGLHQ